MSRTVQSQLRKTRFTHSCLCDRKDQIPQLAVCESPGEVYLLNIFFSLLPTSVTRQVGASVKGWGKFFGKSKAFKFTTLSDKVSKTLASPEGPLSNNGDGGCYLSWQRLAAVTMSRVLRWGHFPRTICMDPHVITGAFVSTGGRQENDRQEDLKMPNCGL